MISSDGSLVFNVHSVTSISTNFMYGTLSLKVLENTSSLQTKLSQIISLYKYKQVLRSLGVIFSRVILILGGQTFFYNCRIFLFPYL